MLKIPVLSKVHGYLLIYLELLRPLTLRPSKFNRNDFQLKSFFDLFNK